MKYIVHAITTLIYFLAAAAVVLGISLFVRAVVHTVNYQDTMAHSSYLPGDPFDYVPTGMMCWNRYEYQVAGKSYRGPGGCAPETRGNIRVLYKRSDPGESILYDIDVLIRGGIVWTTVGALLGWWAYRWRSRSVAIHGRPLLNKPLGAGAWGLLVLLGVAAAMASDLEETRNDFCSNRKAMLTGSIAGFVFDHQRRMPGDWLKIYRAKLDGDARLSGSPECLAATRISELIEDCKQGFRIWSEAEVGASLCELSGSRRYRVEIDFTTDKEKQTVDVRLWELRPGERSEPENPAAPMADEQHAKQD